MRYVHVLPTRSSRISSHQPAQRLRPMSYSKSHVILIAFALDTPDSLENVTSKVSQLDDVRHTRLNHLFSG